MHKHVFIFSVLVALASGACKSSSNDADNTARNARDPRGHSTADNAVKSRADLDLTQKIRKAIEDDSTLSTNAHNCKIVVRDGEVTLAGPVASDAERVKVERIAEATVGRNVTNQLEVTN